MNKNIGYIYILRNKAFPDLLKIGYTFRSAKTRAKELSADTGVPYEFEVIYEVETINPEEKEELIHKRLSKYRTSKLGYQTEFFEVSYEEAKYAVDMIAKPITVPDLRR